jgi:hypothetical protein
MEILPLMRRLWHILAIAAVVTAFAGAGRSDDYRKIDLLDIKLDGEKLSKQKIEVTAWIMQAWQLFGLR